MERLERKVPLLGDIPIIGTFFNYEKSNVTNSRVFIIATPSFSNVQYKAQYFEDLKSMDLLSIEEKNIDLQKEVDLMSLIENE